jgi:hypothetical protein
MSFAIFSEATITADGTEQTLAEVDEAVRISGYVSLGNLQAGDTVVIRQYVKLTTDYEEYDEVAYSDEQAKPIIYIQPKEIVSSTKITIQQTTGVYRSFDYEFIKEEISVEPKAHFRA